MGLSVAIITYNEERIIFQNLSKINTIADEIIIVDSYSQDRTFEICSSFSKVKWYQRKFDGFGFQKNYALSKCNFEWVLFLDADEIPDESALNEIVTISKKENPEFSSYQIKFKNYILGKHVKYGGWGKTYRNRFFKKESAKYSPDNVHESLITSGPSGTLKGMIHHYPYKNIHHHLEKMNSYSDLMAKHRFNQGKTSSVINIIISPLFEFFKKYIINFGFLDGYIGFYSASIYSFYTFLKYAKLNELQKQKSSKDSAY